MAWQAPFSHSSPRIHSASILASTITRDQRFISLGPKVRENGLGACFELLADTDERIKGAGRDPHYALERMVQGHLKGQADHSDALWALIMFDAFLRVSHQSA